MSNTVGPKVISKLERLNLSVMGNPRFRVTFTDGTVMQTQTDSSVGYCIENPEYRDVPVMLSTTRAGRIWGIKVAPVAAYGPGDLPQSGGAA